MILLNSPSAGPASFAVGKSGSGKPIKTVVITLPADGGVRLTSGGNSMAVTAFASTPAAGVSNADRRPTLSGRRHLDVVANQPAGSYTGQFTLIANFQ